MCFLWNQFALGITPTWSLMTYIVSVTYTSFVAAVLWVGNLATLGGSGGMLPRKKMLKNNPLNGDYWWDFWKKMDRLKLTKWVSFLQMI